MDPEDTTPRGDYRGACRPSPEAAQIAHPDTETWLQHADTAQSIDEAVTWLNQVNAWLPSFPEAKQKTYQTVQELLKQDPFLLYHSETDHLYHVQYGDRLPLIVPKDRSIPEPYPADRPAWLQKAYHWLLMALFGLLLAGVGAMVFATLAAVTAIGVNFKPLSNADRIRSLAVLILSGGLWLCGLLLGVILLVHVI